MNTWTKRVVALTLFSLQLVSLRAHAQTDPLPSWNDSPAKQAIFAFVRTTTDQSSPKFVAPEARIATFDQDGTLWVERPMYTQVVYSLLAERAIYRRAVEAVIWGMPAVNYDLMLQEMLSKTSGKVNQVVYWGCPLDWRNQALTPNPDALYFMAFFNTKDGPIVLDLPPGDKNGSFGRSRPLPTSSRRRRTHMPIRIFIRSIAAGLPVATLTSASSVWASARCI
jgi:hypothetical protein